MLRGIRSCRTLNKHSAMSRASTKEQWEAYRDAELERLVPMLATHGFVLDDEQQHLLGERFLMQALSGTSGRKLILTGSRTSDGKRVIIKATSDEKGKEELRHEVACRDMLDSLDFAYRVFHSPAELASFERDNMFVIIREFIDQDSQFIDRPTPEQFTYALAALKEQESAHANVHRNIKLVTKVYERYGASDYIDRYIDFRTNTLEKNDNNHKLLDTLTRGLDFLQANRTTIERYNDFLTHWDFVPHNFRIHNDTLYLLDLTSIRFANKYESWARFCNFMVLYNPELLEALLQYVRDNRCPEEYLALRLMRTFRLGEIVWYYTRATENSTGDLQKLNRARIELWADVLGSVLNDQPLPEAVRQKYIATRDALRSDEEKKRQKNLH